MKDDCIFCKIISGKIPAEKIFENEKYLAFLDVNPINPGHTLVIPKKHNDYLFDLDDEEYKEFMLTAKNIAKIIKGGLNPKRIGLAVEGFFVPHVHIHLVPLNKGNELNPERAKSSTKDELEEIAKKIKSGFKNSD